MIRPQNTRQAETKAGLTMSHDILIPSPKHPHKNLLTTKSEEASSDLMPNGFYTKISNLDTV